MSSNVFSQLAPRGQSTRSFYEQLRGDDNNDTDIENVAGGQDVDEDNWAQKFRDQDLDHIRDLAVEDSRATVDSRAKLLRDHQTGMRLGSKWPSQDEEVDNDVPASLLVERHAPSQLPRSTNSTILRPGATKRLDRPEPASRKMEAQWAQAQAEQPLHDVSASRRPRTSTVAGLVTGSAKERAMWRWINVSNLDVFMKEVYEYYLGSGFWCIVCERILHLVQSAFIAVFLTFLTQCIDYSLLRDHNSLSEVVIGQCTKRMSWFWNVGLWFFVFYFIWKTVQFSVDTRRLLIMQDFYVHLLEIPEQDMQTVSWQDIVARIMALRDANPNTALNLTRQQRRWLRAHSKERLDAVDIASRLMRKDNYLIALINKDVLDLSLPVPMLRHRQFFSGTLQWWLYYSVIDLVFDHNGQVNQEFLKSSSRGLLSRKLRDRFIAAGIMNLLGSPFWVCYQVLVHLLTYYNEFKKDSSTLGDRRYTALAKWKFREFNELPHFFQERINMSYPFASRYMDQFPKRLVEQVAQAITFMSGAITFVLAAVSFLDPELFLGFEITKDKTALFYIGVFGTIWALARGMISEETMVFNPEFALKGVTDFTHYIPDHWQARLHSFDVKKEFSELYKLKVVILVEEIIGIFLASFVLMSSAPRSSDRIVDFFREFTIHVDGLGYVCSFAEFDFKKDGAENKQQSEAEDVRGDYYSTKHGKMAASYYGFLENYVKNPKTGIPGGHLPPSVLRQQFYPPPSFPGLNSPTLAAEVQGSRAGRGRGSNGQAAWTPRLGPSMTAPSPLASVLLDPHHQPPAGGFEIRSPHGHRGRAGRGEQGVKRGVIQESGDSDGEAWTGSRGKDEDEEELYESAGPLGESHWQTSPLKRLSRESSEVPGGVEQDTGVLGLIYQFQQAHRDNRMGGG